MARVGERLIDGKLYLLCGRGPHDLMLREAESLRREWDSVRVLSMTYTRSSEFRRLVDDYACYVFGRKS